MPQSVSGLSTLAVFAHPDDEGFGSGGSLAMLVAGGARITLVCATNGDAGEVSDPELATPETLAQVRREELRQAMNITGVTDLRFLGYRDSGMAGTDDNNHPDALARANADLVTDQLVAIIREVQPELVITFDPTGVTAIPTTRRCTDTPAVLSIWPATRNSQDSCPKRRGPGPPRCFTTCVFLAAISGVCGSRCWTPGSRLPSLVWRSTR